MVRRGHGWWKRPITRTYAYNLDLGESYYSPMSTRFAANRSSSLGPSAVELPASYYGATSYLDREIAERNLRSARAASEIREKLYHEPVSAWEDRRSLLGSEAMSKLRSSATSSASTAAVRGSSAVRSSSATRTTTSTSATRRAGSHVADDVVKRVADVHMMPWDFGPELDEAQSASQRSRLRIQELERELEDITRRALTSTGTAVKSAAQMAREALMEDEANVASSYRKSKRTVVEDSSKRAIV